MDLYLDSIRFEESSWAHYIHHLLEEGNISLDDNISKIDFDQADHLKVVEMSEREHYFCCIAFLNVVTIINKAISSGILMRNYKSGRLQFPAPRYFLTPAFHKKIDIQKTKGTKGMVHFPIFRTTNLSLVPKR